MEYIRAILCDWLPVTVRGLTAYYYDDDGMPYYTIFINANLSSEMQCAAYDHEISHIDNNDVNGKPHTFFSGPRFFEIIVAVEKLSQLFTLFKLRRF